MRRAWRGRDSQRGRLAIVALVSRAWQYQFNTKELGDCKSIPGRPCIGHKNIVLSIHYTKPALQLINRSRDLHP